jgi:microcystin-dependent protein
MQGVIGVITCFASNFAPRFWAFCNGQLLQISQNTALFSILGTTYGGNGQTTFALPDLRGRVPVSQGQGPGLSNYFLGQVSGTETVTLLTQNLPPHVHTGPANFQLQASSDDGADPTPNDGFPSRFTGAYAAATNASMLAPDYTGTINNAGASQPVPIRSPFLGMNYIICLTGVFPSRN